MVKLADTGDFWFLMIMVYEDCKIYGPYLSKKDNRLRIVAIDKNGKKTTVSYPKYLIELHLNRYLTKDETIDHIDCNPHNNEVSNLRVLDCSHHISLDVKRLQSQAFNCSICKRNFSLDGRKLHDAITNRKRNKAGPFCSRSCAGIYSKGIQNGGLPLTIELITPSYTTLKTNKSLHEEIHEVDIAKTVNA